MTVVEPDVAAVVVTYGHPRSLERLADSMVRVGLAGARLAIHDNSPEPLPRDTLDRVARQVPDLSYLHCDRNCGFGAGVNEAVTRVDQDYIFVVNPDAWLLTWDLGWTSSAIDASLPYDLTAPQIFDADGRRSHVYGRRRSVLDEMMRRLGWHQGPPRGKGYISGAAFICRRETFKDIGGFDEGYFLYYEDIDLCRRAQSLGFCIGLTNDVLVQHLGGESASGRHLTTWKASYRSGARFHGDGRSVPYWWRGLGIVDAIVRLVRSAYAKDPQQRAAALRFLRFAVVSAVRGTVYSRTGEKRHD